MKWLVAPLLLALASLAASAAEEIADLRYLQAIASAHYHRLDPSDIAEDYHIYVRLPDGYAEDEARLYPAVYLLDGGNMFPLLSGFYRYLELGEEIPRSILVGISYGSDYYRGGNLRSRDFTAPAADVDYWGGAGEFQAMLRKELIPFIEQRYRADPARRVIFGQSLGGQFVLYTALTDADLFWGHIAVNPALHRNLAFFLQPAIARDRPVGKLYVASAADDAEQFRGPALAWIGHWTSAENRPWQFRAEVLPDESHFSAAPAAFRHGMSWLFAPRAPD